MQLSTFSLLSFAVFVSVSTALPVAPVDLTTITPNGSGYTELTHGERVPILPRGSEVGDGDLARRQLSGLEELAEDLFEAGASKAGKVSKTTDKDAKNAEDPTSGSCAAGATCVTGIEGETKRKRQLSGIEELAEDLFEAGASKAGKLSKTMDKDAKNAQDTSTTSCPAGHSCVTGIEGETK